MTHLSECIALYRDDPLVSAEQYGRLIEDAIARDEYDEAVAEAPEPEPYDDRPCRCGATDVWHAAGHPDCRPLADASPEIVATYVLSVLASLQETVDQLARGLGLLNDLDTKRQAEAEAMRDELTFIGERLGLRADEVVALNNRIENLTRIVGARLQGDA